MTERTKDEAEQMIANWASDEVQVHVELEDADLPPLSLVMKDPGDPGAGLDTMAGVGFDIEDVYGNPFSTTDRVYLGVFDDADCTIPSVDAFLEIATTGTFESGDGTNAALVNPVGGVFACSVSLPAAADQVVYLKAWAPPENLRPMGTNGTDSVTFST